MPRSEKEIKEENERHGTVYHSKSCGYPKEPCSCEVDNKEQRNTRHKNYCSCPNDPCDCRVC